MPHTRQTGWCRVTACSRSLPVCGYRWRWCCRLQQHNRSLVFCFRCSRPCPQVQRSHWHMSCWHGGSVCTFPSVPLGCLARQQPSHASHLICVCALCVKASACEKLLFYFLSLTHNVYSHLSAPAMAAGVSILRDLSHSMSGACSGGISTEMETGRGPLQHRHNSCRLWNYIFFMYYVESGNYLEIQHFILRWRGICRPALAMRQNFQVTMCY